MERKRFTEEQIIGILKEADSGRPDQRPVPQAGDGVGDLLPMAPQVRRDGSQRGQASLSSSRSGAPRSGDSRTASHT